MVRDVPRLVEIGCIVTAVAAEAGVRHLPDHQPVVKWLASATDTADCRPGVEGLTFRPGSHRREVLRANGRRLAFTWCEIDCIVTAVAAEAGVRHQITRSPAIPHQL